MTTVRASGPPLEKSCSRAKPLPEVWGRGNWPSGEMEDHRAIRLSGSLGGGFRWFCGLLDSVEWTVSSGQRD